MNQAAHLADLAGLLTDETLAGVAGAHICRYAFDQRWVQRIGPSRAVRVTPEGERAFTTVLDLAWDQAV